MTFDFDLILMSFVFFFSSRRRHTRCLSDWSSDVCSSDLVDARPAAVRIDDRARVIPAFFRDAVLHQPGLPGGGGLGRALQLVAERIGPEQIGRASCREIV